jgi:hypothetical protein
MALHGVKSVNSSKNLSAAFVKFYNFAHRQFPNSQTLHLFVLASLGSLSTSRMLYSVQRLKSLTPLQ